MIIESNLIVANRGNLHIESYTQEAFGNIISSAGYADNDLHLHERGQEDGYIDLYYFGARWYDPELGRWLSPEPLGLDGPNLYHFNFNDPVNGYDPNGHASENIFCETIVELVADTFGVSRQYEVNEIENVLKECDQDSIYYIDKKCKLQNHHLISKKIEAEMKKNLKLRSIDRNDERLIYKAYQKGYDKWHRLYDDRVVNWLRRHKDASAKEFINYLNKIHKTPGMRERVPNVNIMM